MTIGRCRLDFVILSLAAALPLQGQDSVPREVKKFHDQFQAALAEADFAHEVFVAELDKKYLAALAREEKQATGAGDLDLVVAIRKRIKAMQEGESAGPPGESGEPEPLQRLAAAYRSGIAELNKKRAVKAAELARICDTALEKAQEQLTKQSKLEEGVAVKALREKLRKDYLAESATSPRAPITRVSGKSSAGAVNILELVDLERDVKEGSFIREDGVLIGSAPGVLETGYRLPAEYDVAWEFESNSTAINLLLVSPIGKRFEWMMKGWSHKLCAIREVDGLEANQNRSTTRYPLESGTRYRCDLQVRKDRLVASIDGEEILNFETDWSDIEIVTSWHRVELGDRTLGIHLSKHKTKTYLLEVTPR